MEVLQNVEDFVTVVSVEPENFVTVLSIGERKKDVEGKGQEHLEEEVEVFRLPGERLGFGLKFEGGNKTTERVRRLFVQSCAEQSPASRAKCSWGSLGEGDEILSIDGVPVSHMTRLECVRRLKESQLVIKLVVRCRGALRPEVVSAERKCSPDKNKVPPELPSVPPPVPPRKLRQPRGSADGEANPSPAKKSWDNSKSVSSTSSDSSPQSQNGYRTASKSTSYESCNSSPKNLGATRNENVKNSPKQDSPDLNKSKREPPEAMVYLDARSQDGSSTHGSTSDDTGSSMSTVVDRFSTSDRFSMSDRISTVSTNSSASTISDPSKADSVEKVSSKDLIDQASDDLSRILGPFELSSNHQDYLLTRLANSEAVTYVESLGDSGVERVTAVVAPNTILIEETITLQPPLSFQDAPLSYGHETRPGLLYTDLAADSATHFRPIKDDAAIVECVNGDSNDKNDIENLSKAPPPLPARNHVNRINVNQDSANAVENIDAPVLPPKPLPRKDIKVKRKRPPPPPPPPKVSKRDVRPLPHDNMSGTHDESTVNKDDDLESIETLTGECPERMARIELDSKDPANEKVDINGESPLESDDLQETGNSNFNGCTDASSEDDPESPVKQEVVLRKPEVKKDMAEVSTTNKMLEIIEMKKVKALHELSPQKQTIMITQDEVNILTSGMSPGIKNIQIEHETSNNQVKKETTKGLQRMGTMSLEMEDLPEDSVNPSVENLDTSINIFAEIAHKKEEGMSVQVTDFPKSTDHESNKENSQKDLEDEETYRSLDEVKDDLKLSDVKGIHKDSESPDDDEDTTDDSEDDDDYYWQSNLATIGEEEETNSLEYTNANNKTPSEHDCEKQKPIKPEESNAIDAAAVTVAGKDEPDFVNESRNQDIKPETNLVNGRMDNCGGGQRLPPDGDEFPAAYQEFGSSQQYLYVSANSRTSGVMSSNGSLVLGESQAFATSETFKLLPSDGDNVKDQESFDVRDSSGVLDNYAIYGGTVVSEKKIEIGGYYQMDAGSVDCQNLTKDTRDECPPPLPATRPPPVDSVLTSTRIPEQSPRKFSLNGDTWRQDDKSGKSVRDKIAMFSSQSSLESPLFPSTGTAPSLASRRLSKYKSSEDVFEDKKIALKDKGSGLTERTQSSFDLSATSNQDVTSAGKYNATSGNSQVAATSFAPKNITRTSLTRQVSVTESKPAPEVYSSSSVTQNIQQNLSPVKNYGVTQIATASVTPVKGTGLTKATSFSGGSACVHERSQSLGEVPATSQVSRANSLASLFKRPNEDMRRTSLNQLIEQRRKGISKLRGLIIPEKEAVPVVQPIIDLPEIKSRDSILLQQIPIHDKWGSQSSLASITSTASAPMKTSSFKMPAPQIMSKYSPAFKRKSLTVCGSSTSGLKAPTAVAVSEAPKSLESICSPTRSDYSFDFVSTSSSPEAMKTRPKISQKKTRNDYDDSDNDSAVSSSQSSISRGFSPPMSPVPSERSTVSSERSYLFTEMNYQRPSNMESPSRNQYNSRTGVLSERSFGSSDRSDRSSSSSSSSSSSPNPLSPQPPEVLARTSQPVQQVLKRSSSTDTNCSSSSTLTSGSQASAESLSRRVLKPQSVEAINRKNILASARCRSGRDLNGSPLIQRKFSDDEETPVSKLAQENGIYKIQHKSNGSTGTVVQQDIKIAYIEVTESLDDDNNIDQKEDTNTCNRNIPLPAARNSKKEVVEAMKTWTGTKMQNSEDFDVGKSIFQKEKPSVLAQEDVLPPHIRVPRSRTSLTLDDQLTASLLNARSRATIAEPEIGVLELTKPRSRSSLVLKKSSDERNDVLTVLSTKSRSRSSINSEEVPFGKSRGQMSLEDILAGKPEIKPKSTEFRNTPVQSSTRSWMAEKSFTSKIPTPERSKPSENLEELLETSDTTRISKIPTIRTLGRRSASVTDMKKAFEKPEIVSGQIPQTTTAHNRFPSLDSSVEDSSRTPAVEAEAERYCGEQFGSISSLASSTSLISQQELAQLVEEASLEEARGAHDVVVVLLHKENPTGSVGIALAGGSDCEAKEITVHRVLAHSIADKDGRVQRGDRILSINGRSTRGLTHRESLTVLKQPRSEVVLVVSRAKDDDSCRLRSRTESVETIVEGYETNGHQENTAWGPPATVAIYKDGAGLGFSLEGGRDSPLGDRPLVIKKIFTGGAAEKTGALRAGDQLLEVNGNDVTRMSRIEAWSLMKKLHDGEVNLLVKHPATKSS